MEQDVSTLNDYVTTFRRRKLLVFSVAFFIMLAFVAVTFSLPAVYRSTGTILIEQQDIPEDLIPTTVTSFANERIQIVGKRVMSTENLTQIVERYDLYEEQRATSSMDAVVERLRADTLLETVSAEVTDPRSGRSMLTTIAFTLSYDNEAPETAQKVASDLAQLYLDENAESRTESAVQTSSFLSGRAEQLETGLRDIEGKLADFKERHGNSLPALSTLNRDRLDTTEDDINDLQSQIGALTDSRNLLQSELALISPQAVIYTEEGEPILSAQERLIALQREYVTLSSRYASDHPDLIRVRKEIELLSGGQGGYTNLGAIEAELAQRQAELEGARQRYSSDHPDVQRLTRVVEGLEEQRAEAAAQPSTTSQPPTNPVYVQKQGQLTATVNQLRAAEVRLNALRQERGEYESRLTQAPQVEREYTVLTRQYESTLEQYREIQSKQQTAQLATSLETEEKGERFALIEPPTVPGQPVKPNRMALLILGFVLASGCGIGLAALVEAMDTSVRGAKDVIRLFDMPPLASIPYVENHADVRRRIGRNIVAAGVAAFSVATVALIIQLAG